MLDTQDVSSFSSKSGFLGQPIIPDLARLAVATSTEIWIMSIHLKFRRGLNRFLIR